jgi:signal transduction histidine kinase
VIINKEIFMKRKDGSTFPVLISANNLLDKNGSIVGSNSIIKDITEIYEAREKTKESEEKIKHQLEEMNKLDVAKDEFAAMTAHELKTPIVPILLHEDAL